MNKHTRILMAFSIILGISLLTGFMPNDHLVKKNLKEGNQAFISEDYDEAIELYSSDLENEEDDRILNNIGLSEMKKADYENALKHMGEISSNFILRGNANYYLAESQTDTNAKVGLYKLALSEYKEGIKSNPEDLLLKYNYEFVLNKLDAYEEQQSESEESEGEKSEGEKSEGEKSEGQESEGQESEEQGSKGEESEENSEDEESVGEKSDEESEEGQESMESDESQSEEDGDVAQILYLLEQKESESLKNNQEIRNQGGADSNDW